MFCIDECSDTARFLCFGNGVDSQCCLTGRFRTIYFDDSTFRITAYTKRIVQGYRSGRDDFHILNFFVTQFHDRAFTEALLNLVHSRLQGFQLLAIACTCSKFQFVVFLSHFS